MVTSDRHLESLVAQLRSSQSSDRQQAAQALAHLGPAAQAAIPALIQTFRHDDDKTVQGVTAFALRQMGSAVVPELRKLLGVPHLRLKVAKVLRQIGTPEALAAVEMAVPQTRRRR